MDGKNRGKNMTDQLDLSGFPNILPESDKTDVQKRSDALVKIKESAENFISLITIYVKDLASFDKITQILDEREVQLKQAEFDVAQKEKEVYAEKEKLQREKLYIANATKALKEREEKIINDKDYLNEIEIAKQEFEDRKTEALKQEKLLDEKKKGLEALITKQRELEEKEAMLEKSAQIDAERKKLLDIREARIKNTEQRLHIEQQE